MILVHEYAVDPDGLTDWRSIRDLSDKVGVSKGRIIARLPKSWFRDLYDRFSTSSVADAKLEMALRRLERSVLPTGRTKKIKTPTWLETAESEHQKQPFRAIIAPANPRDHPAVMPMDELSEDHERWAAPRELALARKGDVWVNAIELLLTSCSELMFIDPHFKPDASRYQRTLKSLCNAATKDNSRLTRIEYHVENPGDFAALESRCRNELPFLVPLGVDLEFFIWSCKMGGQDFHARYVLTNHGGIRFEQGLDDSASSISTTDVSLLDDGLYRRRRTEFTHGHPDCAFTKVHSFTIKGLRVRS